MRKLLRSSWHVDYWDGFGWKDEFSSPVFSQRQVAYSRALNFSGTYTPQMFVDGTTYFIGTKMDKATKAITQSAKNSKPEIKLLLEAGKLKINIPALPKHDRASVYVAFTQDNLTRKIGRGNNAGKTLTHSSVARDLRAVASIEPQMQNFNGETVLQIQSEWGIEKSSSHRFCSGKHDAPDSGCFENRDSRLKITIYKILCTITILPDIVRC